MKAFTLVMITCLLLLPLAGCGQSGGGQGAAASAPTAEMGAQHDASGQAAAGGDTPAETAQITISASYDDIFFDINDAAFTTWKAEAIEDNGNYFRSARIDVVDENGYDHQGNVYVCFGDDEFTQAYRVYLEALQWEYGDDLAAVAGFRNAAVTGERTYRDMEVAFFCMQEVVFTDLDGAERSGVVVALDGPADYTGRAAGAYSDFFAYYGDYGRDPESKDK